MPIAYALVGGADYLVPGDEDLLTLGKVENVRMIAPEDFWKVL